MLERIKLLLEMIFNTEKEFWVENYKEPISFILCDGVDYDYKVGFKSKIKNKKKFWIEYDYKKK